MLKTLAEADNQIKRDARRFPRYGALFFLGVLLSVVTFSLEAQSDGSTNEPAPMDESPGLDESTSILMITHEGDEEPDDSAIRRGIDYVAEAVEKAFSQIGIKTIGILVVDDSTGGIPSKRVQEACREAGVRWGITVYTRFQEAQLSWRISIYDGKEGFDRATDNFSISWYIGITASNLIETSAQKVVHNWQKSFAFQGFHGIFAADKPQRFTSPQEGVVIWFGLEDGLLAGTIENGILTTPIFRFVENMPVYGEMTKEGYWSKSFSLPQGITDAVVSLPILQKKTRHTLSLITEFRGSDHYALDFEYRFNVLPDRFFLKLDWALWQDTSPLSGLERLLHQEVRFSPGLYFQPKKDFPFRVAAGTGISLAFAGGNINFLADPLWVDLEYHFSQWAVKAELRVPSLWGYSRDIFGEDKVASGLYLSVGIMLKW
ncbi:MAG: hypothetical protein LBT14_10080 [Treponema sp.]|jgi:hypothetical protein|nr:hypothetical protein [Treponema sp.]